MSTVQIKAELERAKAEITRAKKSVPRESFQRQDLFHAESAIENALSLLAEPDDRLAQMTAQAQEAQRALNEARAQGSQFDIFAYMSDADTALARIIEIGEGGIPEIPDNSNFAPGQPVIRNGHAARIERLALSRTGDWVVSIDSEPGRIITVMESELEHTKSEEK